MEHFKITITENSAKVEEGSLSIIDFMNVMCAIITSSIQSSSAEAPEAARKELFDAINLGFSKCLENAFPEYELHPELTEEVMQEILKRENEVVADRASKVATLHPTPQAD